MVLDSWKKILGKVKEGDVEGNIGQVRHIFALRRAGAGNGGGGGENEFNTQFPQYMEGKKKG